MEGSETGAIKEVEGTEARMKLIMLELIDPI
jgi:hypothetical protein